MVIKRNSNQVNNNNGKNGQKPGAKVDPKKNKGVEEPSTPNEPKDKNPEGEQEVVIEVENVNQENQKAETVASHNEVEATALKNEAESETAKNEDEAKANDNAEPKAKKEKKGLFEGMFKSFGYVPDKKVSNGLNLLAEVLKMDPAEFEKCTLPQKFEALKKAIEYLDTASKYASATTSALASTEVSKPQATEEKQKDVADEATAINNPAEGVAKDNNEEAISLGIEVETFGKDNLTSSYTQSFVDKLNDKIFELQEENKELKKKHSEAADLSATIADKDAIIARKESDLEYKDRVIQEREDIISELTLSKEDYKEQVQNLTIKHNGLKTNFDNLSKECADYKSQLAELQKENETLRNSDAGQLTKQVEALSSFLDEKKSEILKLTGEIIALNDGKTRVENELDKTKNKLEATEEKLEDEIDKVKERNTTISSLTKANSLLTKDLETSNKKVADQSKQITEKDTEIEILSSEKKSLIQDKTSLQSQVGALTADKNRLTSEKEKAEKENNYRADFIKKDVEEYAEKFTTKVKKLVELASEDFLLTSDPDFTSILPRHQEKVSSSLNAFERAINNINPADYKSRQELEDAYYEKIISQLEELSGLTRIAQWYAYSCVPFMIDKDRMEGLVVNRSQIKKLYDLATEILAMVGARYVMPSLYVESINDDDIFENVTGERQSNIEFMCSNAREHKSSIDRSDADSVIIDVLEIGYADNKGNHKNAQVII